MANTDKDILITPNTGENDSPEISFVGFSNSPIKLRVLDDNTVSFEGGAGQLFSVNNNLSAGNIFSVNDISGIPGLAYSADGNLQLSPYTGNTVVGGTTGIGRLHVVPVSSAPSIILPDPTNPRYSVGFGSVNVTNQGQRLDFYAGDSGSNTSNLGTAAIRMSLTGQGNLGLATNNPGSMVDIRPITYSNNQASNGYQLGTTGGQWIAKFFMRSDSGGTPFIGIETPADAQGNTVEAFQVQGQNAGFVRLRPGGADYIVNASSQRLGINYNIGGSVDSRSVLEIDGGIRIRDNNSGASPSKPGHLGLWERGIDANWKWFSQATHNSMDPNNGTYRHLELYDYRELTTWRTQYARLFEGVVRLNDVDNSANNGFRYGGRMFPKTYNIVSIVPGNGNINNDTGVATSGTPTVITLNQDISEIYGPFTITNITGWPTTAPTPDGDGNYATVDIYLTLANNSLGQPHRIEFGTGLFLTGVGGGLDGPIDVFRIQGDRRIRVRKNLSAWTGAATTNGGSCRARWIRTAIYNAGTSNAQSVNWNWLRTYRFKTDAANPARTLTIGGNYTGYPSVSNAGNLVVYRDYSNSHILSQNTLYTGNGNQQKGWSDYSPAHITYSITRTGNNNAQEMAVSYTGTNQAYRGHSYNEYGAYVANLLGANMYVRNNRSGRTQNSWGYYADQYTATSGGTGYSATQWSMYGYNVCRYSGRVNDMRGGYFYLRAGDNAGNESMLATVNNAFGVYSLLRADGGTMTNGYLYYGAYGTGSNATVPSVITNKRGIWLVGCTDSRIDGNLELNGETATLRANRISCFTGAQELILAAGESIGQIGGNIPNLGDEVVYHLAENGIRVYSSNNNWQSGQVTRTATYCDSNGNASLPGTLTQGSDVRLKSNIRNIPDALNKVMNMRGAIFNRIDKDDKEEIGLIAQEVETILPQIVEETEYTFDGNKMKSISYGNVVALLIEAIKEQQAQIEDLKSKIQN